MTAPGPGTRHVAVVLNPQAGSGLARREWPRLARALDAQGLSHERIEEPDGAHALRRVLALPPGVPVLAAGGDGTVGALLPALVGTGRPLGIIPLGTGNDFAGMLGLRPGHFEEALARFSFTPRQVDALDVTVTQGERAGQRHVLLNGLGMGFDAQVTLNMARAPRPLRGFARYAWAALVTVSELGLTQVQVKVDGHELYLGPSALVAVMNGARYGGGFQISPQSDARDGRANVLASGPLGRAQLLGLMARVLRGRHLGHAAVYHGTGQAVTVRWAAPTPLHLDGDLHGLVTELQVRVLPGAVTLLNG
ncbi:diacylglycerol/lipid kinase family protein [Deinococcus hohokamensis]|uniref:Diacylglycerol/lipid kinase family protein n=1 Tax=Deinococcus hohokamensis TaxID=309883 RepID=A0ABV9I694_9DEIO